MGIAGSLPHIDADTLQLSHRGRILRELSWTLCQYDIAQYDTLIAEVISSKRRAQSNKSSFNTAISGYSTQSANVESADTADSGSEENSRDDHNTPHRHCVPRHSLTSTTAPT